MSYYHGIKTSEQATTIKPAVNTEGCLPVIVGVAPIHLATDPAELNTPVLCYTYAEAVAAFGYKPNFGDYGIAEAIYTFFSLYGVSPVIFVNVLDKSKHKMAVSAAQLVVTDHTVTIKADVLKDTLVVKSSEATLAVDTDYTASFDDDGSLVIALVSSSSHYSDETLTVSYDKIDPSKVTTEDIIGGIDAETGKEKGLEVINTIFTKLGVVPGMIGAPGYSDNAEVAAVMASKAASISGLFKAVSIIDGSTTVAKKYTDVYEWKNKANITSKYQVVCWPMATMGTKKLHLSTVFMATQALLTYENDDIPYKSPSNKTAQIDGICLSDGTAVELGLSSANYLNGNGIVTAINLFGGWKLWGNNTACYPTNTDPKDRFFCVRAMFNWDQQTFIRTYWTDVDQPMMKRYIQSIIDSENIRMNGLVSSGVILAGSCEYREADNPATSIVDGISHIHKTFIPPVPNREIDVVYEFDSEQYAALMTA
ncbi:phage tail sheath family protein [uncultured Megasphaera sp.]|uniref:phage tail sheath family protein n=1 Tax=uncultured Megasphaera sp. TaxID=165188 RepID=UPI002591C319|nr:phage tail sheath family protein [uncultured Megasphaera sp.]